MPAPPVYLDECVDRPISEALRARGFDVLTAIEAGRGEDPDDAQLEYATGTGRVLLSYNRTHFRRLHATWLGIGRQHGGILLIPQAPPVKRRELRAAMLLDWLGTLDDYRSRLFQWNDLQRRLLDGFRLPGYTEDEVGDVVGRS
jgi:hypothetical protein